MTPARGKVPETGTFDEYKRLLLSELERMSGDLAALNAKLDALREDDLTALKIDVAMLKVKASLLGAAGGVLVAILSRLLEKL